MKDQISMISEKSASSTALRDLLKFKGIAHLKLSVTGKDLAAKSDR
jgi:hypothetical protein